LHERQLELLAPARDAAIGIAAIDHGADAVYIGGPAFGARQGAGNPLSEIARLVAHAHSYHARVFAALNTILRDDELEPARRLAFALHEAGVDGLIVQDLGLLMLDLPPLQLHASTQCDIRTPAKARFLEDVGFSQLVLARELSLDEIRAIRAATSVQKSQAHFLPTFGLFDPGRISLASAFSGPAVGGGCHPRRTSRARPDTRRAQVARVRSTPGQLTLGHELGADTGPHQSGLGSGHCGHDQVAGIRSFESGSGIGAGYHQPAGVGRGAEYPVAQGAAAAFGQTGVFTVAPEPRRRSLRARLAIA
jgi:hypothetical protein